MTQIQVLGLIGRQGAGKDYFTSHLRQMPKTKVHVVRMAESIKAVSEAIFKEYSQGYHDYAHFEKYQKENVFLLNYEQFRLTCLQEFSKLLNIFYEHNTNDQSKVLSSYDLTQTMLSLASERVIKLNNESYVALSPRLFQQWLGTDIFRNLVHNDFWTIIAKAKLDNLIEQCKNADDGKIHWIVCPDVRFKNEADIFERLAYIHRHQKDDLSTVDFNQLHASEMLCERTRESLLPILKELDYTKIEGHLDKTLAVYSDFVKSEYLDRELMIVLNKG